MPINGIMIGLAGVSTRFNMRKLVGDCTPWGVVSSMITAKLEVKITELLDKLHRLSKSAVDI
jgi:hypothetical protein